MLKQIEVRKNPVDTCWTSSPSKKKRARVAITDFWRHMLELFDERSSQSLSRIIWAAWGHSLGSRYIKRSTYRLHQLFPQNALVASSWLKHFELAKGNERWVIRRTCLQNFHVCLENRYRKGSLNLQFPGDHWSINDAKKTQRWNLEDVRTSREVSKARRKASTRKKKKRFDCPFSCLIWSPHESRKGSGKRLSLFQDGYQHVIKAIVPFRDLNPPPPAIKTKEPLRMSTFYAKSRRFEWNDHKSVRFLFCLDSVEVCGTGLSLQVSAGVTKRGTKATTRQRVLVSPNLHILLWAGEKSLILLLFFLFIFLKVERSRLRSG